MVSRDDRPDHRVRLPAEPAGAGGRGRAVAGGRGPQPAGRVRRRRVHRAGRARSSGWPGWSAPAARRSWRPSTAPAARAAAGSRWTAARCGPAAVPAAVRAGMGWRPEERKSQALLLGEPVYRNVSLAAFGPLRAGRVHRRRPRSGAAADEVAARLDVRPRRHPPRRRARSPAATSRRSCWPAGCCRAARCCCSTSPPAASTSARAAEIYALIRRLAAPAWRCCWSPARCPRCSGWPTGCWWCGGPGRARQAPAAELDESRGARPGDGGSRCWKRSPVAPTDLAESARPGGPGRGRARRPGRDRRRLARGRRGHRRGATSAWSRCWWRSGWSARSPPRPSSTRAT